MLRRCIPAASSHLHRPILPESQRDVVVDQANVAIGAQHDIGRFYISVENSIGRPAVQIIQCLQELACPANDIWLGQRFFSRKKLIQALSLDIVHDGIDNAILLHKVIDLRDICMAQPLQHIHFPPKSFRFGRQRALIRFQYHRLFQPQVPSKIDHSPAARTNFAFDLIHPRYDHAPIPVIVSVFHTHLPTFSSVSFR